VSASRARELPNHVFTPTSVGCRIAVSVHPPGPCSKT
jgi:hypothetical protein